MVLGPYPDLATRRFVVSEQGGVDPHWSSDSRERFYLNGEDARASPPPGW